MVLIFGSFEFEAIAACFLLLFVLAADEVAVKAGLLKGNV